MTFSTDFTMAKGNKDSISYDNNCPMPSLQLWVGLGLLSGASFFFLFSHHDHFVTSGLQFSFEQKVLCCTGINKYVSSHYMHELCCLCLLGFFCSFFFSPKDHVALFSGHWPSLTHLFSSFCLLSKDLLYGHSQPVWLSIEIAVRIYIFTEFGNSLLTAIFTLAASLHSLFNINSLP